jgi:hypothetical protein
MKFKFPFISFLIIFLSFSLETSLAYTCPNYEFTKNLSKGDRSADVRVMQEILNLDKRTIIAYSGPGSKGNETTVFGKATRESLKRFQALFIEYIGIADGKFNEKTRASMNTVCKGPFFTGGKGNVYDKATTTPEVLEKIPPIIGIASVASTTVDYPFRAYIGASEAIKTPTLDGLIISGGTAGDIRKTSSTTFTFLVTPNSDAKEEITLQFEAESVSDLAGNKNENASNEWVVKLDSSATVDPNASGTVQLVDLPLIDLLGITPSATCAGVTSVAVTDYSNPCYGRVPMTGSDVTSPPSDGGGGGGGGGMEQIMQVLQGLLKGLLGGGGSGGAKGGGEGGGPANCACNPAIITTGLFPKGGSILPGRYNMTTNPGMGSWVSNGMLPPPPICGQAIVNGKCFRPEADITGMPVLGTLPPPGVFNWSGLGGK